MNPHTAEAGVSKYPLFLSTKKKKYEKSVVWRLYRGIYPFIISGCSWLLWAMLHISEQNCYVAVFHLFVWLFYILSTLSFDLPEMLSYHMVCHDENSLSNNTGFYSPIFTT